MNPMNVVFARLEQLIRNTDGHHWLEALTRLQLGQSDSVSRVMIDEFIVLGICTCVSGQIKLTGFGQKCADSAREYLFWLSRDKKFHSKGQHPVTTMENYRNKNVLEIGPGWGCNLIPLSTVARRAIGVEIEPVYIEFSRILAKREAVSPPQIVLGSGEDTPFASNTFDWVLLWSALQYMEINATLKECCRVLRSNGCVLVAHPLFKTMIFDGLSDALRRQSSRSLFAAVLGILNTVWYQSFHSRLRKNFKGSSTARPVFVTTRYLIARARHAGLLVRYDLSVTLRDRWLLVFQKP